MYPLSRKAIKCRVRPLKKKPETKAGKTYYAPTRGKDYFIFFFSKQKDVVNYLIKISWKALSATPQVPQARSNVK